MKIDCFIILRMRDRCLNVHPYGKQILLFYLIHLNLSSVISKAKSCFIRGCDRQEVETAQVNKNK